MLIRMARLQLLIFARPFPFFSEILRARHADECREQSKKIGGKLATYLQANEDVPRDIRDLLSPRRSIPRRLVQAAVQEILYNPSSDPDKTKTLLLEKLRAIRYTYEVGFELEELAGKGRWEIIDQEPTEKTFEEECRYLLGEKTEKFLDRIAGFLSTAIDSLLRRFTVVSLDLADPQVLKDEAAQSFPQCIQGTKFFGRAAQLQGKHIQADVFSLPFRENSVSLYTCFEGWPFYFGETSMEAQLASAQQLIDTMKKGGRAIFFPWHLQEEAQPGLLEAIERFWESKGCVVAKVELTSEELKNNMRDREQMLTHISPVFKEERVVYTMLILDNTRLTRVCDSS